MTTEAHASARLIDGVRPRTWPSSSGRSPTPRRSIVNVAYRRDQVAHPLDGFGAVVPAIEGRSILAVSFLSVKFPRRAPAGHGPDAGLRRRGDPARAVRPATTTRSTTLVRARAARPARGLRRAAPGRGRPPSPRDAPVHARPPRPGRGDPPPGRPAPPPGPGRATPSTASASPTASAPPRIAADAALAALADPAAAPRPESRCPRFPKRERRAITRLPRRAATSPRQPLLERAPGRRPPRGGGRPGTGHLSLGALLEGLEHRAVEVGVDDLGVDVALAADRRGVAQPLGDVLDGADEFFLAWACESNASNSRSASAARTVPAQVRKSLAVNSLAGDLAEVVVDVGRVDRPGARRRRRGTGRAPGRAGRGSA